MNFRLSCRELTRLVLAGEDRQLGLVERLRIRAHLLACAACPRFVAQARFMRRAVGRWRRYSDGEAG